MPAAKLGTGPWGEALKYWLPKKNMNQADLARETGIQEKTISSIARGFHTTTRKLQRIADVLGVAIEDVMISPTRRNATRQSIQLDLQEAIDGVLRRAGFTGAALAPAASLDAAITSMEHAVASKEADLRARRKRKKTTRARRK